MDNSHGGGKLPIGYRFHPTDEELVLHYLKRKVFGIPLPAYVIPQFDVFISDPSNFPGDLKEKRYFFSQRKGNENSGSNLKRQVLINGHGYWKEIGKYKNIVDYENNQLVGIRRTLVYNEGKKRKRNSNHQTKWILHEFSLVGSIQIPNSNQMANVEFGDWLVYSLCQKQKKSKKGKKKEVQCVVDFTNIEESSDIVGPPQPSSPSFNGDNEVLFDDDEEENSFP
ncbi:hypothetical protein ACFE04_009030 [Oxalis oulophora]